MKQNKLMLVSILSALSISAHADGVWTSIQGNAAHTGYVNVKTDPANFHLLWTKQLYENDQTIDDGASLGADMVTTDKLAYLDINYSYFVPARKEEMVGDRYLMAVKPETGETVWLIKRDPTQFHTSLAYGNNKILSYRELYGNKGVDVIQLETGQLDFTIPIPYASGGYQADGLLVDHGKMYPSFTKNNYTECMLYSLDAGTGKIDWTSTLTSEASYSASMAVATPDYIVYKAVGGISVYDKKTGKFKFKITDNKFYDTNSVSGHFAVPVYDAKNNVVYVCFRYAPYGQYVVAAFDLTAQNIKWMSAFNTGIGFPALADNEIYIIGYADKALVLQSMDTATGKINWTWAPESDEMLSRLSFPIVTKDLVFINGRNKILAISRKTHQKVWEFDGSGKLALDKHTLYILKETYRELPNSEYRVRNGLEVTAIGF